VAFVAVYESGSGHDAADFGLLEKSSAHWGRPVAVSPLEPILESPSANVRHGEARAGLDCGLCRQGACSVSMKAGGAGEACPGADDYPGVPPFNSPATVIG
jgi:hypothetical protein